jgi:enamine deaminase RidA (YjgF/YER057c/UK114 family)
MRNLLDGLEEAGMNFSNVVAANVYLDNMDGFSRMNAVYHENDSPPPKEEGMGSGGSKINHP